MAAAVLVGIRYQRASSRYGFSGLYGRLSCRRRRGGTLRRPCAATDLGVRNTGSGHRAVSPGRAAAVGRRQSAVHADPGRSALAARRGNAWPTGVLPRCGLSRPGFAHGLYGRDAAVADSPCGHKRPTDRTESRFAVRDQYLRRGTRYDSRGISAATGIGPIRHGLDRCRDQCGHFRSCCVVGQAGAVARIDRSRTRAVVRTRRGH